MILPSTSASCARSSLGLGMAYSPLPMALVEGTDSLVHEVNAAFCQLIGKSRDDLIGRSFAEQVPATPVTLALLERVRRTGKPENHTELQPPAPPLLIPLYWSYVLWAVPAADNQVAQVAIQVTETVRFDHQATAMNEALMLSAVRQHELADAADASNASLQVEITKHIRTTSELREARAVLQMQAGELERIVAERTAELRESIVDLEAFSYSVAHDLRAPIRSIRSFTTFALELCREHGDPEVIAFLEKVIRASDRMDRLIQDVLTLSAVSRERLAPASVDVDSLVRVLIEERAELAAPKAEIEIERPLHAMRANETSLTQCLTNLLGNAVKFVPAGLVPHIRIWTEDLPFPMLPASTLDSVSPFASERAEVPMVRMWFEDNGIGIPTESQKRIFEIFHRLHTQAEYEGTGIGLAIVRKAIERMGGRIGVVSESGHGSRFWLELPKA